MPVDVGCNGGLKKGKIVGFGRRFPLRSGAFVSSCTFNQRVCGEQRSTFVSACRSLSYCVLSCGVRLRTKRWYRKCSERSSRGYFRNVRDKIFPFFPKMHKKLDRFPFFFSHKTSRRRSLMAKLQPSKLVLSVRFRPPAPGAAGVGQRRDKNGTTEARLFCQFR